MTDAIEKTGAKTGKAAVWLRVALMSPFLIAMIALISGEQGHSAISMDSLSGGSSALSFMLFISAGLNGMAVYAISSFLLFFLIIINGFRAVSTNLKKTAIILVIALISSYSVFYAARKTLKNEILQATLSDEKIENGRWSAESCGRGSSICVKWTGNLGRGEIKMYTGSKEATQKQLLKWKEASSSGQNLTVVWGRTPKGWTASKKAQVNNLSVSNN